MTGKMTEGITSGETTLEQTTQGEILETDDGMVEVGTGEKERERRIPSTRTGGRLRG